MSEQDDGSILGGDPFDLKAKAKRRREAPLTVSIDPGSTEYLFTANYARLAKTFRDFLPAVNTEEKLFVAHNSAAGTTIEILINAASIGGGIIAAELLKEASKDIWKALKGCMISSRTLLHRPLVRSGNDDLKLSLPYKDVEVAVNLRDIGLGDEDEVQRFVDEALPAVGELANNLYFHNGWSGPPFSDKNFRVSQYASVVDFIWETDRLTLSSPICLACEALETDHKRPPCWACTHYVDRPAADKRPHTIGADDNGNFPESDGSHFVNWSAP